MIPEPAVTVEDGAVTVCYPDGMSMNDAEYGAVTRTSSGTWPKDAPTNEAHGLPYTHTCAPTTCDEHERRFWRAWLSMADVRRAAIDAARAPGKPGRRPGSTIPSKPTE